MTNPLFVANLDTLKARLRLTGVPVGATDTHAILDESILRARLSFYRRLGEQRVTALLAISYVANPTSTDQVLRALANSVEIKLVNVELLRRLPQAWMDASGDINKRWNEEAPFREKGPSDHEREVKRLLDEIEEDMEMLAQEEGLAEESTVKTWDGTPDFYPPSPGDSLRGAGIFTQIEDP